MKLKRLLSLLLAALMLFSTVACGSKEAVDTTAAKTEAVTEEKMPETPNEDYVVVIDKENSAAVDAAERMTWQKSWDLTQEAFLSILSTSETKK